ncbi:Uncharacterized protein APZ42_004208, partial [Daphnia magna]
FVFFDPDSTDVCQHPELILLISIFETLCANSSAFHSFCFWWLIGRM